jgi:hypothetical protein
VAGTRVQPIRFFIEFFLNHTELLNVLQRFQNVYLLDVTVWFGARADKFGLRKDKHM